MHPAAVITTVMFRVFFKTMLFLISFLIYSTSIAQGGCTGPGIFQGGVSVDGGTTFTSQVSASETLFIGGELCPQQIHVGETTDIYAAFEIGPSILFLNTEDELVV